MGRIRRNKKTKQKEMLKKINLQSTQWGYVERNQFT